jgi:acid phosphatase type 7
VVSLDSDCTFVGGCSIGSPEYAWLQQDLANDQHACTLAYWHHPLFSSGAEHGGTTTVSPFWDLLIADSAEVVLNGHSHDYERFSPQTTDGAMSSLGIREFVVGTGGAAGTFGAIQPNSEVRISGEKGVLELTLAGDGYSWRFVAVSGTVLDQGTDSCH